MDIAFQQHFASSHSSVNPPAPDSLHEYITESNSRGSETNVLFYKKGDWIHKAGQPSTRIYEVVAGVVRTSNLTEEGEEVTAEILSRPHLFGNLGILPDSYSVNAKALTDTHVRFYDVCYLIKLKTTDPVVNVLFNEQVMRRLNSLEKRLLLITTRRMATRIDFLYGLFDIQVEDPHGRRHTVLELLTQKDVADLVGTTRQTVAAMLKKKALRRPADFGGPIEFNR